MAKRTYTKTEIRELVAKHYNTDPINVYQLDIDYDDEFRVKISEEQEIQDRKHIEVVSTMTAITNQEDFEADKNKFLKDVIEALLNEEELVQIGDYNKLAEDLFWREY